MRFNFSNLVIRFFCGLSTIVIVFILLLLNGCSPSKVQTENQDSKVKNTATDHVGTDLSYNTTNEVNKQSALDIAHGLLSIGDTAIEMKEFSYVESKINFSDLTLNTKFSSIFRINACGALSFTDTTNRSADTVVLKGCKLSNEEKIFLARKWKSEQNFEALYESRSQSGFGMDHPPSPCFHFYAAITPGGEFSVVLNRREVSMIIPRVQSITDACFMIDDNLWIRCKYKKIESGYLILINERIRDCTVTYADRLYRVTTEGEVLLLGETITSVTNLCI